MTEETTSPHLMLILDRDPKPSDDPTPLSGLDADQVFRIVSRLRPDTLCLTIKGPSGYLLSATSHGNALGAAYSDAEGDDILSLYRRCTTERGSRFFLGYSGLIDGRAAEHRSDWLRLDAGYASYPNRALCPNSAYLDELMIPQLGELIDRCSPDGVYLPPDNWSVSPCYCSACLDEFRLLHNDTAPRSRRDRLWHEWMEFHRTSYERYLGRVGHYVTNRTGDGGFIAAGAYGIAEPSQVGMEPSSLWYLPPPGEDAASISAAVAFHSHRGLPHGLISRAAESLRPRAVTRSGRRLPALPSYPRSADHLCYEAALSLARGGGWGLQLDVYPDDALPEAGLETWAAAFEWVRERPVSLYKSLSPAALLHDEAGHQRAGNGLFDGGPCLDRIRGAHRLLRELHAPHDILTARALAARLDGYSLVVLPEQLNLSDDLSDALRAWVREGGSLLATGRLSPHIQEDVPVFALEDVLGIRWSGGKHDDGNMLLGDQLIPIPAAVHEVTLDDAEALAALAWRRHEHFPSSSFRPGVALNRYGEGLAAYIAADLATGYARCAHPVLRGLTREVLERAWPEPPILSGSGPEIEIIPWLSGACLMIDLIHHQAGGAVVPSSPWWERAAPSQPFTLTAQTETEVIGVALLPGGPVQEWHWENGTLTVTAPSFRIHCRLVCRLVELPAAEAPAGLEGDHPSDGEQNRSSPLGPAPDAADAPGSEAAGLGQASDPEQQSERE